ncbi:MerR family transcriptional regulator [Aquisediminimonas profunda]|uniref:MerR family transcriptional regulator n=1 Tax=Aquisediminimonas profunda TaxID=1550733 RepID=UPI001C63458A|nr:MerR family transcriptional regulator [Aquisediminimonas profunda]
MAATQKSASAFRTIGELADELGLPQHILRYWETRFPQLRPLQRAGNRRYYRPDDVALAKRINLLLNRDGYTVKGVQKLLSSGIATTPPAPEVQKPEPQPIQPTPTVPLQELRAIRDRLAKALAADDVAARI